MVPAPSRSGLLAGRVEPSTACRTPPPVVPAPMVVMPVKLLAVFVSTQMPAPVLFKAVRKAPLSVI